jgi:hypothetical protein
MSLGLLALVLVLLCGQPVISDEGPGPAGSPIARDRMINLEEVVLEARSPVIAPEQVNPGFTVDLTLDAVWGLVDAGDSVTVNRTADGAYGAAEADAIGFFWTPVWKDNGQPADLVGGDTLDVYVNGALQATIVLADVSGGFDVLADQVAGAISGDSGGTQVTATAYLGGAWDDEYPTAVAPQAVATTNASGEFTAVFGEDLGPENYVAVEYPSGGHTVRAYLYPDPRVFYVQNLNSVRGSADPGQEVDVTVYQGAGPGIRDTASGNASEPHGFYSIGIEDAQPGDVVEVDLGGGVLLDTTVAGMSVTGVDTTLDQIAGTAPSGSTVVVRMWPLEGYIETTTVADGSGEFLADLGGIADLKPRNGFRVVKADGQGSETQLFSGAPYLNVIMDPWTELDCAIWRVDGPSLPVTLTLQTATGVYTRENPIGPSDAGNTAHGCYLIWGPDWGPIDFAPGDTVTIKSPTWEGSLVLPDVSWSVDSTGDSVSGEAPAGELQVDVRQWQYELYPIQGSAVQTTTAASTYVATFTDFDVRDGGILRVHHYNPATDFAAWYGAWDNIEYQYFQAIIHDVVEGVPPNAGETVTATLYSAGGVELASTSDDDDDDSWRFRLHFGDEYYIEPGRWVTVTSESGWEAGIQVPDLTVEADADTDMIWGEGPKSTVLVEHDWYNGEYSEWASRFVPVDDYVLDVSYYGEALTWGREVHTKYQAPNGDRIRASVTWPWMYVNYSADEAGGAYDTGHTFQVKVTDSGGMTKATATVDSESGGAGPDGNWWDGFNVSGGEWSSWPLDIQPGDWVHFASGDVYSASVQVGTITGGFNPDTDSASGTIEVPWLASETVEVGAGGWGFPGFQSDLIHLDSGGRGGFLLDFSPEDLTPDMSLGVFYTEPDQNRVYGRLEAVWQVYLPLVTRGDTP